MATIRLPPIALAAPPRSARTALSHEDRRRCSRLVILAFLAKQGSVLLGVLVRIGIFLGSFLRVLGILGIPPAPARPRPTSACAPMPCIPQHSQWNVVLLVPRGRGRRIAGWQRVVGEERARVGRRKGLVWTDWVSRDCDSV
jgi:hypothetical protein